MSSFVTLECGAVDVMTKPISPISRGFISSAFSLDDLDLYSLVSDRERKNCWNVVKSRKSMVIGGQDEAKSTRHGGHTARLTESSWLTK